MKKLRKIFLILAVVLMSTAVFAIGALADNGEESGVPENEVIEYTSPEGVTTLHSAEEFNTLVTGGGTVKLRADIYVECARMSLTKSVTIDLNGHELKRVWEIAATTSEKEARDFVGIAASNVEFKIISSGDRGALYSVAYITGEEKYGKSNILYIDDGMSGVKCEISNVDIYSHSLVTQQKTTPNLEINIKNVNHYSMRYELKSSSTANKKDVTGQFIFSFQGNCAITMNVEDSLFYSPVNDTEFIILSKSYSVSAGAAAITFKNCDIVKPKDSYYADVFNNRTDNSTITFDNCRAFDMRDNSGAAVVTNGTLIAYSHSFPSVIAEGFEIKTVSETRSYTVPASKSFVKGANGEHSFDYRGEGNVNTISLTFTTIVTKPVSITFKEANEDGTDKVIENFYLGVDSIDSFEVPEITIENPDNPYYAYCDIIGNWLDKNGKSPDEALSGENIDWSLSKHSFKKSETDSEGKITYTKSLKDARLSLVYVDNIRAIIYLPVVEGMDRPTGITGFQHIVLIEGKEYYWYKYDLTTTSALDKQTVTINYKVEGQEFSAKIDFSALIYGQIVLGATGDDAPGEVEKTAVANMLRYVREAYKASAAQGKTTIAEKLEALEGEIAAVIGDYNEDGSTSGGLYDLGAYREDYELPGYTLEGKTEPSYELAIRFGMQGSNPSVRLVIDLSTEAINAGVTVTSIKTNGVRSVFASSSVAGRYYNTDQRVYNAIGKVEITLSTPAGEEVITYSMAEYINALLADSEVDNKDLEVVRAMYEFGVAAKEYRKYVEYVRSHDWNDGELTTRPTADTAGMITYTCTDCGEKRTEAVPAGTTVYTRADLEDALASVAWAYYMKGEKVQYDSASLSLIELYYGGTSRHTMEASPEYGTSDTTIFSVCSGFAHKTYIEALDRVIWERKLSSNGINTAWLWLTSDNQFEDGYKRGESDEKDPITANDRDTAILRWIDYEAYLKKASDDEESDALRFGVYDSTSFGDWYEGGILEFYKVDGEENYSYYLNGEKITAAEAKRLVSAYITQTDENGEYVNLRPGDLLTRDTHTLIYIGNGYVLDCNGYKYNISTGVDDPEEKGAIFGRMKTVADTLSAAASDYVITRPLDYYTKDYDGNPANDIIKYNGKTVEMTEATKSRQQYPAMAIDRTVNITPYGTAVNGEELTYSIKISNRTNEANYLKWRKNNNGVTYSDLIITETIPAGTEFVSASEGYTLENGILTWCVDIAAGETLEITYTVRVTAEAGDMITNDGGMVADIPSNSISNHVGAAELSDEQKNTLSSLTESDTAQWNSEYGTDLAFAESVYGAMGITLQLPAVDEIIENMFTPTYMEKVISLVLPYQDYNSAVKMYVPQQDLSGEYAEIGKMLVKDYIGGYRLFTVDTEKLEDLDLENYDFPKELNNTILEFSFDYLEVGDILVYATAKNRGKTNLTSDLASTRVLIYAGNETFIQMSSDGSGSVLTADAAAEVLSSSFKSTNDLFFLLRPSQVIDVTE